MSYIFGKACCSRPTLHKTYLVFKKNLCHKLPNHKTFVQKVWRKYTIILNFFGINSGKTFWNWQQRVLYQEAWKYWLPNQTYGFLKTYYRCHAFPYNGIVAIQGNLSMGFLSRFSIYYFLLARMALLCLYYFKQIYRQSPVKSPDIKTLK